MNYIHITKENEPGGISISLRISLNRPRVYLKTPNAPGQRAFLRCAASFFLEIRQYSCEKMSCATQKSLAAGHIMSFQIHPSPDGRIPERRKL